MTSILGEAPFSDLSDPSSESPEPHRDFWRLQLLRKWSKDERARAKPARFDLAYCLLDAHDRHRRERLLAQAAGSQCLGVGGAPEGCFAGFDYSAR